DLAFERGGDEALDQVRVRAVVHRGHVDHRVAQLRVLADVELGERAQPEDQDEQADDHRQHRLVDEDVGEFHGSTPPPPRAGEGRGGGAGPTSAVLRRRLRVGGRLGGRREGAEGRRGEAGQTEAKLRRPAPPPPSCWGGGMVFLCAAPPPPPPGGGGGGGGTAGPTSAVLRLRLRVGGRLDLVV